MSNLRLSRPHAARLSGLTAALLLALAGGCGKDNDAIKQVQHAEQTIGALTTEGTFASIADDYRRKQLGEVHDQMNKLAADGPEGVRAAALTIAARAKAGVASLDTKVAIAADKELTALLRDLTVGLNTFTLQKSIAEANTGAGTRGLIQTLQGSLDANKKAADDARKEAAAAQAAADDLTTRTKNVTAQAVAKRQEASSLTATMQGVSATQGLEILKRATAIQAQADALDQQAADLGAELGLAQSELARVRSKVAALDEQSTQIQADITAAQARLEEERKLADAAGKAADAAAAAIRQKFADISTFRSGTLEPALQAAVSSSQKAFDLTKQATGKSGGNPQSIAGGNTGKLAAAAMQQNYADALVTQARAFDQLAGTLALVASAQPPLPDAAEYATAAAAARKTSDETLTQARDMYGSVREAIDAIGEEKLKARLGQTSAILEILSSKQGVKAPEPTSSTPAPSSSSSSTPAAAPGGDAEVAEVKKVIDAMHDRIRAGDYAGIVNDMTWFDDDGARKLASDMLALQASVKAFDQACRDKLSLSAAEAAGPLGAGLGKMADPGSDEEKDMTSADYTVTVNGDEATAVDNRKNKTNKLVKRNGKWYAVLDGLNQGTGGMPPGALGTMKSAIDAITADINAGRLTTPEQVQTALLAKMGAGVRPGRGGRPAGGNHPNK
ncbi:MAG TPA: hypothetical protein VEB22_02615 [Phycisphaerales bacterium]|nr:hypothetical protein [Phycisphaerales bacterium]